MAIIVTHNQTATLLAGFDSQAETREGIESVRGLSEKVKKFQTFDKMTGNASLQNALELCV